MANPIIVHINRKYHIDIDKIFRVLQKKSGRTWVYYKDAHNQTKIAVAQKDARMLLHGINSYKVVTFKPLLVLEIEK